MEVISNCKVIEKFAKVIRSIMPIICMVGVEVTYKKGRESEIQDVFNINKGESIKSGRAVEGVKKDISYIGMNNEIEGIGVHQG